MQKSIAFAATLALIICSSLSAQAATITGNPVNDGWTKGGNSLANGTYIRGEGTFSFDIYSAAFTVEAGSNLDIAAGSYSWLPGDQIVGLGGKFVTTDATTAGWSAFQPNPYIPSNGDGVAVNDDVSSSSRPVAKFGTSTSNFTPSTTAPFQDGNGNGSLSAPDGHGGDGAILARITSNRNSGGAGQLGLPDRVDRYDAVGNLILSTSSSAQVTDANFRNVARLMYTWSNEFAAGHIGTWQFVINVSLLERVYPYNAYPQPGDQANMSVQRGDNRFTDGLAAIPQAAVVPEPASLAIWVLLGASAIFYHRRRR